MPWSRRLSWRMSCSPDFAVAGAGRLPYMLGLRHLSLRRMERCPPKATRYFASG